MSHDPQPAALVQGASRGLGLGFVRALLAREHRVVATCRAPHEARALRAIDHPDLTVLRLDVTDEGSVAEAAAQVRRSVGELDVLLNVAGVLHGEGFGPEKRLEHLDRDALEHVFRINAFGPLLVARHFHPLLDHGRRAVLANLSARVGSIEDNRLGGWYAYRASKAAQNQLTRTLAIELQRRSPSVIVVALHPGTVDTDLSAPFQRRVPADRLFDVRRAVRQLLDVIDGLGPDDTGSFRAWDGEPIPW